MLTRAQCSFTYFVMSIKNVESVQITENCAKSFEVQNPPHEVLWPIVTLE
jgi:hypothetical protein